MTLTTLIALVAAQVGAPPELLLAICHVESGHKNIVVHQDGGSASYGPCQVKLHTARMFNPQLQPSELFRPETSVRYGAFYLSYQLKRYDGDWLRAVRAYNRGSSARVDVITSNCNYLSKVINALETKPWNRRLK
jgi:soluble lytic murein transglycosylase